MSAKDRALSYLYAAVRYDHNPAVRVEAVEALESSVDAASRSWIRTALGDEEAVVRFAACVVVGRQRDRLAEQALRKCADDTNASVAVAGLFALHRLNHVERTGLMPNYLLAQDDPTVRRNAAFVLGLMKVPSVVKILASAMRDPDEGVRKHALEAMARHGNRDAKKELLFMANAGVGSEEVFAIQALAKCRDPMLLDSFRYKLSSATHVEVRLAAAEGLGRLNCDDGFDVAIRTLKSTKAARNDPNDPAQDQVLRARQMAAAALGAIGREEALPELIKLMDASPDPRLQVSAARAVLQLLNARSARSSALQPFGSTNQ